MMKMSTRGISVEARVPKLNFGAIETLEMRIPRSIIFSTSVIKSRLIMRMMHITRLYSTTKNYIITKILYVKSQEFLIVLGQK